MPGHAPDEMGGDVLPDLDQSIPELLDNLWNYLVALGCFITSQKFFTGLRSGVHEGWSMASSHYIKPLQ